MKPTQREFSVPALRGMSPQAAFLLSAVAAMMILPSAWGGLTPGSKNIGAVWFIGDSITQGVADGDPNGSPRKSLYNLLVASGYVFTYTGHWMANVDGLPDTGSTPASNLYQYHSGISGSVIGDDYAGRTGMTQNTPNFWTSGRLAVVKPDVILIMLGANDVDQAIDLANAPARLTALVQTIYAQPGVGNPTIFLASITPNRTTVPPDPDNVAAFNAAIPGVVTALQAQGKDVRYVDQFTPIESAYAANMMGDNLHPNATGNNTMAQQWFNAIALVVEGPITVTGTSVSAQTDNSATAGYATASAFSADIVNNDLINAGQPTLLAASWDKPPFFETDPVNDGDGHPADSGAGTYLPVTFGGNHLPFTYTATLDTSTNTLGYKITEIRSFAGWNQNGSKLANQKYQLLVRTVGNSGFTSLGTFTYAPFDNSDTAEAAATKMVLTPLNGVIATGVDAVRFVAMDPGFTNGAPGIDGSVFQEFDVIGSAISVPPVPVITVTGTNVSAQTDNSAAAGYATASAFFADIVANDLINAGQPTLLSASWDKPPFFESDPVNDGDGHPAGSSAGTYLPVTLGGNHMPFTYTAMLNTSLHPLGYKITEIRSFAGWNQNGSKLANQKYQLLVRAVGNSGFTSLGTFTYAPFDNSDTAEAAATKMVLTPLNGVIATGVDAVRFVVLDHGFNNGALNIDGSVFFEFDVIGSAVSLPPPAITVTGTNASAQTDNSAAAGYATASAFSADIVANDLINAGQPTLLSASWDKPPFFEDDPVNDGDGHPAGSAAGTFLPATFGGGSHLPFTYTAMLNTSLNTLGYRITEIRSFAGWNQNGSKLANQKYEFLVRRLGDSGFTSLGTFTYAPFDNSDTAEAAATKMVLTALNGVIATGVDAVRFVVMDPGFNNGLLFIDGSVYFEFDVIGSAIPVPPVPVITVTGTNVSAQTDNSAAAGYATASAFSVDILANDLINAGQPTLLSASWDKPPFFEDDPVNDGDGHPAGSGAGTFLPATFGGGSHLPFTYTALLNTSSNTLGYTITEIRSFAGWNQNGASLANQKYELRIRCVGSPVFTSMGVFEYSPFDNSSTQEAAASKMTLTVSHGVIATGVDAVRFIVMDHGFNSSDIAASPVDGSVYFEFDVIGHAVPADIAIAADAGQLTVTFTGVLQAAPAVTGPFTDVPGFPSSPLVLSDLSQTNMMFFRARNP
jgi:hypothetical protein